MRDCRTCANTECPFPDAELQRIFKLRGWAETRENMRRLIAEARCYRPYPVRIQLLDLWWGLRCWLLVLKARMRRCFS